MGRGKRKRGEGIEEREREEGRKGARNGEREEGRGGRGTGNREQGRVGEGEEIKYVEIRQKQLWEGRKKE